MYIYNAMLSSTIKHKAELYTAHSRVGRWNLGAKCEDISIKMELSSVQIPNFRRFLEALRVEWRNPTPRYTSLSERKNENIKYFISTYRNKIPNILNL